MTRSNFRLSLHMGMLDGNTSCSLFKDDGFPPGTTNFSIGPVKMRSVSVGSCTLEDPTYSREEMKALLVKNLREELTRTSLLEYLVENLLEQAEKHCADHPVRLAYGIPPRSRFDDPPADK